MAIRYSLLACSLIVICSYSMLAWVPDDLPPEAAITNGLIHAHLYLPDAKKGYYRAVRFDWSGIVSGLSWSGHQYYGQWFPKYSPTINDAITGPVEAFDPVGYEEAKPGETFLKIGVGELIKPDSLPYNFARYYDISNPGHWQVKTKDDEVQFRQVLIGDQYSYDYSKTVKLLKDKPVMILSHTLKNTGSNTIETQVFDHNFLVMDSQPTGPGFTITFPDTPEEQVNPKLRGYATLTGNQLAFIKEVGGNQVSFKDLTNGKGANYIISVENHNTGAGVKITASRPMAKLVFWSWTKTVCPEPYIKVTVPPGQTFTWDITYEYYNCTITKK